MAKPATAKRPTNLRPVPKRSTKSPFFRNTVQQELPMAQFGRMGKLPIFYYDNTTMTAIYTASTAKVKSLLPQKDMHPVEIRPGRCMVAFTAFEYRDTDIDPYNEFSISFLISYGKKPLPVVTPGLSLLRNTFEAYVWQLPVTTEIARWGGVELYGYPKFIGQIEFKRSADALSCTLSEDGRHILTLRGANLKTAPAKQNLRFRTYSMKNEQPLCSNIYLHPQAYAQSVLPGSASLELGTKHPIAKTLRTLRLSKNPIMYQYAPQNELMLFGPRNLIDN